MCGNFGIIFLDPRFRDKVLPLLREMIRITMMRGAQSAGIVTYGVDGKGVRTRVNNGKRTDLCTLLLKKLSTSNLSPPQLFQGHTRFATSSIAALPGCHPHQYSAPARLLSATCCSSAGSASSGST